MSAPADAAARERALDISQGFIVKAPAGSGKTGLLVRRYLALLCVANTPEEVLAITFTRKATAELRERVMSALHGAGDEAPDDPHEHSMWELARALRARDAARGWHLAQQPSRLGVYTIDGLASSLARRLPWLSGIGGTMTPVDDARPLYEAAARRTLGVLETPDDPHAEAVADMLAHLDNDVGRARQLIESMLGRREQWLPLLQPGDSAEHRRTALESGTGRLVASLLQDTRERVPRECVPPLMHAIGHALEQLADTDAKNPLDLSALAGYSDLPPADASAAPAWQALTTLLLTRSSPPAFRKSVTKAQGFPTGSADNKAVKADFTNVLGTLSLVDDLAQSLDLLRLLPPTRYSDGQWRVLESLSQVLIRACAELRVSFAEGSECDFNELTSAASTALGYEDAPTELALLQDLRIQHVLVDEFQDTSTSHGELVKKLVAGFSPGDGRTLFIVGDPMQSIYRFRQAEVGQFLAAWSDRGQALIDVPLECAELTANFRSRPAVVNWLNDTFSALLPARDEPQSGQVAFAPAQAQRSAGTGAGVYTHALLDATPQQEAARVVELVQAARQRDQATGQNTTIALLTRSRAAVMASVRALGAAGLRVRGTDLEPLDARPVVRDLVSLTRAIVQPADRLAAFAVLRAPWAGVSLADLEALAGAVQKGPLTPVLANLDDVADLSRDGLTRIARVTEVLNMAMQLQGRQSLARRVRRAWLELGGPACTDASGLTDADTVLALLHDYDGGDVSARLHELDASVAELYAAPASGDADVEVMTMHKSKGLEFGTVILPGLQRSPRGDDKALLNWRRLGGNQGLALAPLGRYDGDGDEFAQLLTTLDKREAQAETARLLYVACSRACEQLHLVGSVKVKRDEAGLAQALVPPPRGSLLDLLWPRVSADFEEALEVLAPASDEDEAAAAAPVVPVLRRLPADYSLEAVATLPASSLVARPAPPPERERVEFGWVGRDARHVGTVVHALLQQIAEGGFSRFDQRQVRALLPVAQAELTELGVSRDGMERAVSRVESALLAVHTSERAAWLFDNGHEDARNELALSAALDGAERAFAIDRTFIENAAGQRTRWIVDYKTGGHEGGNLDAFLDSEQLRYRHQLEDYARVVSLRESLPVRLGLYFPLVDGWRAWTWVSEG